MKPNKIIPKATIVSLATLSASIGIMLLLNQSAVAADVKITSLGSIEGEFCQLDRAMIFEDPDGTREASFIKMSEMPVHVPLSGVTMCFNHKGLCTAGC